MYTDSLTRVGFKEFYWSKGVQFIAIICFSQTYSFKAQPVLKTKKTTIFTQDKHYHLLIFLIVNLQALACHIAQFWFLFKYLFLTGLMFIWNSSFG